MPDPARFRDLTKVRGGSVPFRGDIAMTQQGAPREAPVPLDRGAQDAVRVPASGDPGRSDDVVARARTHRVGGYTVVELHGEIDIAGVGSVGPALDAATAGDRPAVIVDLRPTAFFDCSGLGLLCRAHRRVRERGGRMRLVCDDALILRTLRAGRMLDVLGPVATMGEALGEEG
ncbi:hypothetical protein GCM10009575_082370 [Streptomyces rhizosphaericus]|uniref:Anti-sigma factor antagonist n=3 Tax=Streptomyces rhizosphaericus TaxID=114699 RepID=A0ABN1RBZ9_9ACTN